MKSDTSAVRSFSFSKKDDFVYPACYLSVCLLPSAYSVPVSDCLRPIFLLLLSFSLFDPLTTHSSSFLPITHQISALGSSSKASILRTEKC